MFVYWGRRGLTRFALEVARTAFEHKGLTATVSVSRQNEGFAAFEAFGPALHPVDTFSSNKGLLTAAWRIPLLRRQLRDRLTQDRVEVVIELMPHAWSSFVMPVVQAMGVRHVTIVHDADVHPGDYRTRIVKSLLERSMRQADHVLTLSDAVAQRLMSTGRVPAHKLSNLFHPDFGFYRRAERSPPLPSEPLKLLFLGRIMPYKGLGLCLDMVDRLRADGLTVELGVFGEGRLGEFASRLEAMGAEVMNRWLSDDEISAQLPRFHAIVLSHTEASQSGVAATALGAGMPSIATPVGGLMEQIVDGRTGVLSDRIDAASLAQAATRLLVNPVLYRSICQYINATRNSRSMALFVDLCVHEARRRTAEPTDLTHSS
jgi:glycosyltransferase involved in cell wall biosynthesis